MGFKHTIVNEIGRNLSQSWCILTWQPCVFINDVKWVLGVMANRETERGRWCILPWRLLAAETLSPYLTPLHPKVSGYHSHLHATMTSLYALPCRTTDTLFWYFRSWRYSNYSIYFEFLYKTAAVFLSLLCLVKTEHTTT